MKRSPNESAEYDQRMAQLDEAAFKVMETVRSMRADGFDEIQLTDWVMNILAHSFSRFPTDEALVGAVCALSRALVLLSRTDIPDNPNPLV